MRPGKVVIGPVSNYSFVTATQGHDYLYGTLRTSPNKNFSLIFRDGHLETLGTSKWVSGIVCLIENDSLLWLNDFERPTNAVVSDNGRVVVLHTYHKDYSSMSSTPKEFVDLGGTLTVMEKSGETLMTSEFGSNIYGCAVSPDGELVLVATAYPDNCVYCFQMQERRLLWKYNNHDRENTVLGLEFDGDKINVFAGNSIATSEKKYVLKLDGTLTPEYQRQLETLKNIKKQRPQEKANSLLALVKSGNMREVSEGLSMLETFVKTKGSIAHYPTIVDALDHHLQVEDGTFDLIWKVARQMLKQNPKILDPIVPHIITRIKNTTEPDATGMLVILGELGRANPAWIKNEEQFIKQKLRSKIWNERRFAAFAIGSIGSADASVINDTIPLLIEYISEPEKVSDELNELARKDFDVNSPFTISISSSIDAPTWIRDACIDAIGMIGKRSPESVNAAIPLLEKLSKDAPSTYTIKKAIRALDAIRKNI